jgi:hypothetical protein
MLSSAGLGDYADTNFVIDSLNKIITYSKYNEKIIYLDDSLSEVSSLNLQSTYRNIENFAYSDTFGLIVHATSVDTYKQFIFNITDKHKYLTK